jgi:two-component system sensor histidine kinase TctE
MIDAGSPRTSIRRRLLAFLIVSLLLAVSAAAVVTYRVALSAANDAYDRSLLDPVFDIADNVVVDASGAHVDLPQKALEALVFDQVDKVMYQVRSANNALVSGVDDLPAAPNLAPGEHRFFDATYQGAPIRVAALRARNGSVVQVGETRHKRNRLVGEILVAELVPTTLIALGAVALAWLGVTRGLRPLEHLRTELLERSPRDLRPIPEGVAPVEVAPVVTAFNQLLDHLRDANVMQQRFLANAAHQLRTPLAGLQMHLELLLRRELPPEVRRELERMHTATVRASRLATQLLALAKAESAPELSKEFKAVDLRTIASAAARDWAPKAMAQDIDLGFSLAPALLAGDPMLLPQMLDNLIDNALRYTPAGGTVTVTTGSEDGAPYLCVEDTGPGIPAAETSKVRERFYRIAGTPGEGSGLGLAIVQEVVDRHGGVLEIDARGELPGTRIRISFPPPPVGDLRA